MSAMTTFIPAPSKALAMPSPMPLAPPVTKAVLPGRFCMPRSPICSAALVRPQSAGQMAASHIVSNTYSLALAKRDDEGDVYGRGGARGDRYGGCEPAG